MNGEEIVKAITALFGATGVGAIVIAFLAYKSQAIQGRRGAPEERVVSLDIDPKAAAVDRQAVARGIEALIDAVSTGNGLLLKIAALMDEDREHREKERERDLERREMRILHEEERRGLNPPTRR